MGLAELRFNSFWKSYGKLLENYALLYTRLCIASPIDRNVSLLQLSIFSPRFIFSIVWKKILFQKICPDVMKKNLNFRENYNIFYVSNEISYSNIYWSSLFISYGVCNSSITVIVREYRKVSSAKLRSWSHLLLYNKENFFSIEVQLQYSTNF